MRKIFCFFIISSYLLISVSSIGISVQAMEDSSVILNTDSTSKQNVVTIPDENLKALLNEKLNKSSDSDITQAQLESITRLYAQKRNIKDLTGLEHAVNLTYLSIWKNEISDLTPLQNLTKLTFLDLSQNQISDLSPLQNLTKLNQLYLIENQIGDLSGLQNLLQLRDLYLSQNQVSDLVPLQTLTQLEFLDLNQNQVSDLTPLQTLTRLNYLYLSENQVSDLSGLQNLTQLGVLDLSNNQIHDLSLLNMTSGFLNADNQTISLPDLITYEDVATIENPLKFSDGSFVNLIDLPSDTTYDSNGIIKWEGITSTTTKEILFSDSIPGVDGTFSGTLYQTIIRINKPIFQANDITIKQDSVFNPLDHVTVTDVEDDLDQKPIQIKVIRNEVKVETPGKYEVEYQAIDSDGNTTNKTIIVTVIPKLTLINQPPLIMASDVIISVGETFDPLANVKVEDLEDGPIQITSQNVIENTVNSDKPGIYKVVYQVTDQDGETTIKEIDVEVISETPQTPETPETPQTGETLQHPQTGMDIGMIGLIGLFFIVLGIIKFKGLF